MKALDRHVNSLRDVLAYQIKDKPAIVLFVVFLVASVLFVPRFGTLDNLFNIFIQSAELIILACGMTFVFINASIDFSVIAILGLSSIAGASIITSGKNILLLMPLAILSMFAIGLSIGVVNAFAVTRLKMPSFIATMSTQLIFSGLSLTLTQSSSIAHVPASFNFIAQGKVLGVPLPILLCLLVIAASYHGLARTVFGRRLIAVGTNQRTSFISGIPVSSTISSVFLISGACAALASIIMTGRLGAGLPALGSNMLVDIIAAVVMGGTSVSGGKGNMIGTVFGAIFVIAINNCLNLLQIDWYLINVCKGLLILVVGLYSLARDRV